MLKRKNINIATNISFSIIFLATLMIALFFHRDFLIYRDFSIIWHGALLFSDGYSPFKDFIMPISPVSILITGLFLSFTEKSWMAFQIFQLILNIILLIAVTIFLNKYEKNKLIAFVSVLIFSFFYLFFLTHPWYNNLGAFFLITGILLSNYDSKKLLFLSGIISGLTFFTKLDFGLMAFISSLIIIFQKNKNNSKQEITLNISVFLFAFISFVIIFLSSYESEILQQTIALSSEVAANRFERIFKILAAKNLILVFLGLWCIFFYSRQKFHFLSYGLIMISAAITSSLGGIEHSHYYFIFVLPPIVYEYFKNSFLKKYLPIIITAILFLIFPIAKLSVHIYENIYYDNYESEFFNKRNISSNVQITNLDKCSIYLKNIYGPSDFCKIKKLVQDKIDTTPNKIKILNISEINFLGTQLGQAPIKYHPIWYKDNQTVNKDLRNDILRKLIEDIYDLVIIQNVSKEYSSSKSRVEMVNLMNSNKNYSKVSRIFQSPACMNKSQTLESCGINIYLKKSTYDL